MSFEDRKDQPAYRRVALEDDALSPAFDRLSRLAQRVLGVPIALVSIVDGERQVVRGGVPVEEELSTVREILLVHSFCEHVVETDQPLIVENVPEHAMVERFSAMRNVGAYLGLPLTIGGEVLGTFCVIDNVPRPWTPDDIAVLQDLAASALSEIALRYELHERLRVEHALRAQDTMVQNLLRSFPNGSVNVFDRELRYVFAAGASLEQVGLQPELLIGKALGEIFPAQTVDYVTPLYCNVLDGVTVEFELEFEQLWFNIIATPIVNFEGTIDGVLAVAQNITERKQVDKALRESDQRFRTIFEHAPIGIINIAPDGRLVTTNQSFQALLGYSAEELASMRVIDLAYPDDLAESARVHDELVRQRRSNVLVEQRCVHRDGHVVWVRATASSVLDADGAFQYAIAMVEDIGERKRIEQELALARRQLIENREIERLHLARELHDGAVQQLLGISYQLVASPHRATDTQSEMAASARKRQLDSEVVRKQLLEVVSQLRGLTRELRPAGLEEFGLAAALENYVAQVRAEWDGDMPDIVLNLDDGDSHLPTSVGVCLFRVAQEAIRNVLHHAAARRITISLSLNDDDIELCVEDDGHGFVVPHRLSQLAYGNHFGLIGMSERVATVDGYLSITSEPGHGTTVRVRVGRDERTLAASSR
jgi:PAS domain S-box-containing protein